MCAFVFEYLCFVSVGIILERCLIAHVGHRFLILIGVTWLLSRKALNNSGFVSSSEGILYQIPSNNKCYCSFFFSGVPVQWWWSDISMLLNSHVWLPMSLNKYFLTLGFTLEVFVFPYPFPFSCEYSRALHFVKEYIWMSKACICETRVHESNPQNLLSMDIWERIFMQNKRK